MKEYIVLWLKGFIVLILLYCLMNYVLPRRDEPYALPKYSAASVSSICALFQLDEVTLFCRDINNQDAISLEEMLYQEFPIGATRLDQLMTLVDVMPHHPTRTEVTTANRTVGYCQDQTEGQLEQYSCYIYFPNEIGSIRIFYVSSTNAVAAYGVLRPSDS